MNNAGEISIGIYFCFHLWWEFEYRLAFLSSVGLEQTDGTHDFKALLVGLPYDLGK